MAAVVSVGLWNQWVLSCLPFLQNSENLLELGFGTGYLQRELFKQQLLFKQQPLLQQPVECQVFGLDESSQMIRQCRRALLDLNSVTRSTKSTGYANFPYLVRGLAQTLPFPDRFFDIVVTTFPTPYIINPQTLDQIHRTLKDDGRLIIALSAEFTSRRLLDRLAALLFKITGQATSAIEAASFIDRFTAAGFHTRTHWRELPTSKVMILEVQKFVTDKE